MKLNISGWYHGVIGLENKVIDTERLEKRPRIKEADLHKYYDEFLKEIGKYSYYFEDQKAFQENRKELMNSKRPKLVAREPKYPGLFNNKAHISPLERMFNPRIKKDDKYFYTARCFTLIPLTADSPFNRLVDDSNRDMLELVPEGQCEPTIEIPNDRTQAETKVSTTHEAIHYFIINYQLKSGRLFTDNLKRDCSTEEKYIAEGFMQEMVTEYLTGVLVENDKEALFEYNWDNAMMTDPKMIKVRLASTTIPAVSTGILIGASIGAPILLPLALAPGIIRRIAFNKYKKYKKEELTKPIEKVDINKI